MAGLRASQELRLRERAKENARRRRVADAERRKREEEDAQRAQEALEARRKARKAQDRCASHPGTRAGAPRARRARSHAQTPPARAGI
ncbi:unnamed protein product [Pedinophyceae sp. YPF-701]|nr:unnamed protein product [Pedinophyceae sp. YPF-701]